MTKKYTEATPAAFIKTQIISSSLFTPVTANAGSATCYKTLLQSCFMAIKVSIQNVVT